MNAGQNTSVCKANPRGGNPAGFFALIPCSIFGSFAIKLKRHGVPTETKTREKDLFAD